MDMKLEVVVVPVSDVDRAKRFYGQLGWQLDADFVTGPDSRVVQFTPPGSAASIQFGKGLTTAVAGALEIALTRSLTIARPAPGPGPGEC